MPVSRSGTPLDDGAKVNGGGRAEPLVNDGNRQRTLPRNAQQTKDRSAREEDICMPQLLGHRAQSEGETAIMQLQRSASMGAHFTSQMMSRQTLDYSSSVPARKLACKTTMVRHSFTRGWHLWRPHDSDALYCYSYCSHEISSTTHLVVTSAQESSQHVELME